MSDKTAEFGDFQTPIELACRVCRLLSAKIRSPRTILEPTCDVGAFLEASFRTWPKATLAGVEINPDYAAEAAGRLGTRATIRQGDFFSVDWSSLLATLGRPLLVIGNLPWVTNAKVSAIGGSNLPEKTNFKNHKGFDALTGKANFDISEWMLIQMLS